MMRLPTTGMTVTTSIISNTETNSRGNIADLKKQQTTKNVESPPSSQPLMDKSVLWIKKPLLIFRVVFLIVSIFVAFSMIVISSTINIAPSVSNGDGITPVIINKNNLKQQFLHNGTSSRLLVRSSSTTTTLLNEIVTTNSLAYRTYDNNRKTDHNNDADSNYSYEECNDSPNLYRQKCRAHKVGELARAYPEHRYPSWLISGEGQNSSKPIGILLVKAYKAASTTAAGVALRIGNLLYDRKNNRTKPGRQLGYQRGWQKGRQRQGQLEPPFTSLCRWHHVPGHYYGKRNRQRSFLFTSVRDPASRAISRIYFTFISQRGKKPSNGYILGSLKSTHFHLGSTSNVGGFQIQFLSLHRQRKQKNRTAHTTVTTAGAAAINTTITTTTTTTYNNTNENNKNGIVWSESTPEIVLDANQIHQNVQEIINGYDFILVAERMDESLVAMSMIMGLNVTDVLVTSSKVSSSGAYFYKKETNKCLKLQPAPKRQQLQPIIRKYLRSNAWYAQNYGDYLLLETANRSLDLTIERLGKEEFSKELLRYQYFKSKISNACTNATLPPCSNTGKRQRIKAFDNCYDDDIGCGYRCIDEIVSKEG